MKETDMNLVDNLRLQAQCHAQEARSANSTINEIYQVVSGAKGEPGNWNGAVPVRDKLAELQAKVEKMEVALGEIAESAHDAKCWMLTHVSVNEHSGNIVKAVKDLTDELNDKIETARKWLDDNPEGEK